MIILGSSSDFKIAEKAIAILEKLGIYYDLRVASAHRTHEKVKRLFSLQPKMVLMFSLVSQGYQPIFQVL